MNARPSNSSEKLARPVAVSVAAHGVLIAALLLALPAEPRGEAWGAPGAGAIHVSVVSSLPGVPLPFPAEASGRPARPQPRRAEDDAAQLPRFGKESRQRVAQQREQEQEASDLVPSVGGPASPAYTSFRTSAAAGGLSFGESHSFGANYPWYVESVTRRIASYWRQGDVDPSVRWALRAVISFEILRDGTVVNIQVLRSSGEPSVDRSGMRAIQEGSPLDRLPAGYSGTKVLVEFWFDFRR